MSLRKKNTQVPHTHTPTPIEWESTNNNKQLHTNCFVSHASPRFGHGSTDPKLTLHPEPDRSNVLPPKSRAMFGTLRTTRTETKAPQMKNRARTTIADNCEFKSCKIRVSSFQVWNFLASCACNIYYPSQSPDCQYKLNFV
jgi:hypothetical protein